MGRKPFFEPLSLRSLLKIWIENNKLEGLAEVFTTIQDISNANGGVEVAAVVFIKRLSGKIIDVVYSEPGKIDEVKSPIDHRKYSSPGIIQVLVHNHPSGTLGFSDRDLLAMNVRFNKPASDLGLFRVGIDDEFIVIVFNHNTRRFEYINKINI